MSENKRVGLCSMYLYVLLELCVELRSKYIYIYDGPGYMVECVKTYSFRCFLMK